MINGFCVNVIAVKFDREHQSKGGEHEDNRRVKKHSYWLAFQHISKESLKWESFHICQCRRLYSSSYLLLSFLQSLGNKEGSGPPTHSIPPPSLPPAAQRRPRSSSPVHNPPASPPPRPPSLPPPSSHTESEAESLLEELQRGKEQAGQLEGKAVNTTEEVTSKNHFVATITATI